MTPSEILKGFLMGVVPSILAGFVSAQVTINTLSVDIAWIKKALDHYDARIAAIEERFYGESRSNR